MGNGGSVIRVVVADDHPLVRLSIRRYLELDGDIEVVAEAEHGREAVEAVRLNGPDVVILDYQMPVMDGLDAAGVIRSCWPETSIIILTAEEDRGLAREAARAGAQAFIRKNQPVEELREAVRRVASGRLTLDPDGLEVIVEIPEPTLEPPDPA